MNFKLYSNPNTWQACCEKFADKQAVKEFFFSKIQKQQVEYTTVTKSWQGFIILYDSCLPYD